MTNTWRFEDSPDTISITTQFVIDGTPILRAYHDFDGDWQFHGVPEHPSTAEIGRVVSLGCMVDLDPTLAQLHDLPCGWRAYRGSVTEPWVREKNNSFPTFAANGFYLENALKMSLFRDDVKPLPEETRENLRVGYFVKLLFRFADENADRHDGEVERMWVRITTVDKDETYIGTLENDPVHSRVLHGGELIHFHCLHAIEVMKGKRA